MSSYEQLNLRGFANSKSNTLLALDFDGTLAAIVKNRDHAVLSLETRRLLRKVAKVYPTAIITGRSLKDIKSKTKGLGRVMLVGNHGAEVGGVNRKALSQVKKWKTAISRALSDVQGCDIEDKKYSLSVHYLHSKNKTKAKRQILRVLKKLKNVRIIGGKNLFNVVDARAPDKGDALLLLMKQKRFKKAIFVGDDVTDDDVFELGRKEILSVRVGKKAGSKANSFLPRQKDIDNFLKLLLRLRASVRQK